jgi:cytochrome b561
MAEACLRAVAAKTGASGDGTLKRQPVHGVNKFQVARRTGLRFDGHCHHAEAAMAKANAPAGYSRLQIRLHWLVALLIVFQIIGHDGIEEAFEAYSEGAVPGGFDLALAWAHVASGIAIWLFAAWRLTLRFTRGVPPHPPTSSKLDIHAANTVHVVLYGLLLLMPLSGAAAWFLGIEAASEGHSNARYILLPAVLLHVLGALAQHFWFKTDVLKRMIRPA